MKPWEATPPATSSAFDAIDWGHGPVVGRRQVEAGRTQYVFWGHTLGVEQWENGQRSESFRDQWTWQCRQTDLLPDQPPNCALTITRILLFGTDAVGTLVSTEFYTPIGTPAPEGRRIAYRQVDWSKGILDFSLSTPGKPPIEVQLRLAFNGDLLTVQSFRALVISTPLFTDSTIQPIEFRLPAYSYTLYAPFPMPGFRPSQQRGWSDLLWSLSPADQRAWLDLRQRRAELGRYLIAEAPTTLQKLQATVGRTRIAELERSGGTPTPEEERRFMAALDEEFLKGFGDWLGTSSLSADGRQRILAYLRSTASRGGGGTQPEKQP
jgi:hypothetical protein